jgi:flagellar biosynthesis protein FliP
MIRVLLLVLVLRARSARRPARSRNQAPPRSSPTTLRTRRPKRRAAPAAEGGLRSATAVEIAVLVDGAFAPAAILVTITSFTRIIIVLSFVRRALGVNELPPNRY